MKGIDINVYEKFKKIIQKQKEQLQRQQERIQRLKQREQERVQHIRQREQEKVRRLKQREQERIQRIKQQENLKKNKAIEKVRLKEQQRLQRQLAKEDRKRIKQETRKWEREIKQEEKRKAKVLDNLRWKGSNKLRKTRAKLQNELKKIHKQRSRLDPFEVIKIKSNSNQKFTTYFDTYSVKINQFPVDPVEVFQKAINMTITERGLVRGDQIRLMVSHIVWSKPCSTKLLTITDDENFIYNLLKTILEFVEYKNVPLNELHIEVQSTKIPRGSRRLRVNKNNIELKKSIICIKNTDTICLARAIVTAVANINKTKWTKVPNQKWFQWVSKPPGKRGYETP